MADIAFEKGLSVAEAGIGGLKVVDLSIHGYSRGCRAPRLRSCILSTVFLPGFVPQDSVQRVALSPEAVAMKMRIKEVG